MQAALMAWKMRGVTVTGVLLGLSQDDTSKYTRTHPLHCDLAEQEPARNAMPVWLCQRRRSLVMCLIACIVQCLTSGAGSALCGM